MERDAFVEKYHHLIAGMILDAATARRDGANLSVWLRLVMGKVDSLLTQAHHDATKKTETMNGVHKQPVKP